MPRSLMRDRPEGYERVTNVELFFDLVYVFAVTGATFAGLLGPLSLPHADRTPTIAAFVIAFVSSVALWWLYFDRSAARAARLRARPQCLRGRRCGRDRDRRLFAATGAGDGEPAEAAAELNP